MTYAIRLEGFEGPLDLLLHLIDQSEIDIHNVSISDITDQYIEYVQAMQELQLDVASEFLVMASYLLAMKSKRLLPRPIMIDEPFDDGYDDDEDAVREALLQRLEEYRKFKSAADVLMVKEDVRNRILTRPPVEWKQFVTPTAYNPVEDLSVFALLDAFHRAISRAKPDSQPVGMAREEISIRDCVVRILRALREYDGRLFFHQLCPSAARRTEIVATFLAVLELIKSKRVRCVQERTFDAIYIESTRETKR